MRWLNHQIANGPCAGVRFAQRSSRRIIFLQKFASSEDAVAYRGSRETTPSLITGGFILRNVQDTSTQTKAAKADGTQKCPEALCRHQASVRYFLNCGVVTPLTNRPRVAQVPLVALTRTRKDVRVLKNTTAIANKTKLEGSGTAVIESSVMGPLIYAGHVFSRPQ